MSREQVQEEVQVGSTVRRRFQKKTEAQVQGVGTVVRLGKKYRGARAFPAAKVQFKSTSRVLWYFLDQLRVVPKEAEPEPEEAKEVVPSLHDLS